MQTLAGLLLAVGVLLLVVRTVKSYLRLSSIPGPFLAKFSDLWRFHAQNSKGWSARLVRLHEKYGKLVRIGPNHISISDPNAVPIVYSTNPVWKKVRKYPSQSITEPLHLTMLSRQTPIFRQRLWSKVGPSPASSP